MARVVVEEFHEEFHHYSCKTKTAHHDQTATVQTKDVLTVTEDLGNPFEGKGTDHDHLILNNKEFADHVQCSSGSH